LTAAAADAAVGAVHSFWDNAGVRKDARVEIEH
jgi:hypothetical protein